MEYRLIRSKRRSISLEITPECEILVRAPSHCPEAEIRRFIYSREKWIRQHIEIQRQRTAAHPEPTEEERKRLIEKAESVLPAKTAYYASVMGLEYSGVRITGARTRFGSCSADNHICYSWRLMQYPEEAVDYVVVHELSHIKHKNHGKDFYRLIASILPDHEERRALLKK